jgi:voltage-gated sodium channel
MTKIRDILINETTVMVVIILNAVSLLAASSFVEGSTWSEACGWVDYACAIFFVIEASLKIGRGGFRSYWKQGWNKFDFIIVLISLPVLIKPFGLLDTSWFATFLVLRLGRLFRLFRLLKFIPDQEHMLIGIRRALRASVAVFGAIIIVNLVLAIGGSLLFGKFAPEHFGNPLLAVYSTFKVFTMEGWYEIPDLLAERADSDAVAVIARIYFVVVVVVGGIIGLSLANAVFVDEMTMDNTEKLEKKVQVLLDEVRAMSARLDAPSGGGGPPPAPSGGGGPGGPA